MVLVLKSPESNQRLHHKAYVIHRLQPILEALCVISHQRRKELIGSSLEIPSVMGQGGTQKPLYVLQQREWAACDPLCPPSSGSVQERPGYELRVQNSVTVQEGLCVHVPCSFSFPWSSWSSSSKLYTYWYRHRHNENYAELVASNDPNKPPEEETKGRFLLTDTTTNNCSLQIRDARRSDTGHYVFRVEIIYSPYVFQGYSYQDRKLDLQVTALTEEPHICIPEPLESGRPTQLTCSLPGTCKGGRPLTLSWAGAAVDSLASQNLSSSVLTFTPRPRDHGTNLTCQVQVQGSLVATQTTIWLNVSYAPVLMIRLSQGISTGRSHSLLSGDEGGGASASSGSGPGAGSLSLEPPSVFLSPALKTVSNHTSLSVLEGQSLLLVCEADSNPPAMLSWSQEGRPLSLPQLSAPGVLELPHVGAGDGGEFTCRAQHPLGSQYVSFSLYVQSSMHSCRCVAEEQQGSWPWVITLIRGSLMGAGFLLTYVLTWLYYTRCGAPQNVMQSS
ncbi:sialic acid-binding Ig-like lectin 14 [Pipistrellus kuhlii]|uniref:sialic acid-binding Ig-like lectin 14 n=1 Tax=Pipistrellus kuhlii TaxID=59472 RepID=UPI001E271499|nr:sialic acid-binding Ig-like lectin 14 [Pipistrellus kuhlii]